MGDGFSRTGTCTGAAATLGTGVGEGATGAGGGGTVAGAFTEATMGFGGSTLPTSTGLTAKYTIPDASTAPVANADTSFQFMFTARPPRLLV
jgi:hypothetical protein